MLRLGADPTLEDADGIIPNQMDSWPHILNGIKQMKWNMKKSLLAIRYRLCNKFN